MFKKAIAFLIAGVMLLAPAAVYGQSCEQGGNPPCGPSCSSHSYNILYDPNFDQTSCPAWEFEWGTERAMTGTLCSGWAPPFARFNGPSPFYNYWMRIQQRTDALPDPAWPYFRLAYTYEIADPMNNPNTQLEVTIYARGVTYSVDAPPGGSQWCNTRHINLGYHPEWVGQPIRLAFWANIPGNAKISVSTTALFQSRFAE